MSTSPATDRRRLLRGAAAFALGAPAVLKPYPSDAQEAAFPNRPLHFVVPFAAGSGTDITGSGEAVTAAASGQVDYSIVAGGALAPMLQGGRIRALLYTGSRRHPLVPDVPTSADAGLPEFQARAWTASAVRSGTPAPIQRELEQLFARAGRHPDVLRAAEAQGAEIMSLNAATMRRFQVDEINRWKRLVADTGITIE
ncbi:MAG TPA: tripartite tricarboxylate transporter substrate-binding protein [Burkholderiaceae bacterium]|nr:tripartite tricarboxylate transporter substrate-binding protein [Burkholderiaceae bacterium]